MKLRLLKTFNMSSGHLPLLATAFILPLCMIGFDSLTHAQDDSKRLITVYDRNTQSSFLTDQKTIGKALKENGVELDPRDTVEPSRDEELIAPDYRVNIYRARPVIVIDGTVRLKVMTPYQVAERIAIDAGVTMYPEDTTTLSPSTDFIGDGAGLQLTIDRATELTLDLYTKKTQIRTQGETVGEMLKEKGIVLGERGRVSIAESTPVVSGMEVRVWREGKQTITVDQPASFDTERIFDADRPIGYRLVRTIGREGVNTITYEIEVKDGIEILRTKIASIITKEPSKQVEIVGIKTSPNALTKSKGAHIFTDSSGVRHRETYYDLNMNVVMRACGQNGFYEVRSDGVKIDSEGYVIIAANLGRYPRCTVVETSVGLAKVYDTGGFAAVHPDGYDIATDWTNSNGI